LSDLVAGRLSWRRLCVLVDELPRDSATARSMFGEAAEWGHAEHLLAAAVDVLQQANWQRAGNRSAPRPKPLRRPGVPNPGEVQLQPGRSFTPAELDALLAVRR
jgi:hypothetical protein